MKQSFKTGAVLITGASTGIGAACALHLDALGFQVFAGVRRKEDGESIKQRASEKLIPLMIDVTDPGAIQAAVETIGLAVGDAGLVGLVNNAGLVVPGPLEFLPLAEFRKQFEVNVFGNLAVTQAFLPFIRQGRGRIVNMGSISGRIAEPLMGPYAASKFALEALSDSLRAELLPWGIAVSLIEPGSVATPIWEKAFVFTRKLVDNFPPEGRKLYEPMINAMFKYAENLSGAAASPQIVANAVTHALTAKRPKTRYLMGPDARVKALLVRLVPDHLRDRLIIGMLRLPKDL